MDVGPAGGLPSRLSALLVGVFVVAQLVVGCGGEDSTSSPAEKSPSTKLAYGNPYYGESDLYLINVDDGRRAALTKTDGLTETSPAWSPDGRKIAFVVEREVARIGIDVMNVDGSRRRQLTRHPEDDSPAWSPDGKEIAFVRWFDEPFGSRIYVLDPGDSRVRPLVSDCLAPCLDRDPAWSPDGRLLAFAREDPPEYLESGFVRERFSIYVIDLDRCPRHERCTEVRRVGMGKAPAWSPDGMMIAFESKDADDPGGPTRSGIWIMNSDGTEGHELTSWGYEPAWSPDGRTIAFMRGADIYVADVDSGAERVLDTDGGTSPAWVPGD